MNPEEFGKILKKLREKKNLTQKVIAKELNVSNNTVSKWEMGKNMPDLETLYLICKKFNLDFVELFGFSFPSKSQKKINFIYFHLSSYSFRHIYF